MKLLSRAIIQSISPLLNSPDIIIIQGARQVGKTCIMRYLQEQLIGDNKQTHFIDLEDLRFVELLNAGIAK